ncbi:succinate dehydrogenase, cytochrome b556 subunit [Thiohalobacter sp.]|uniref:succinate dehydrogenase, cytochrome b556 subunit n=1 Tax=Thiohalobacter sp. TaxID=2025948 RepID=UPI0026246384|nr:succinate dehydrogenase, cytochrome b556 subunit [Thiohalobacter sp.]
MPTTTQRPRFLNLLQIRMPIGAVTSIAHRVSGVLLFLAIPLGAFLFELSLKSEAGFERAATLLQSPPLRLFGLLLAWALMHHLLAGLRFLMLDLGVGLDRPQARRSAWLATLLAPIAALALLWRFW